MGGNSLDETPYNYILLQIAYFIILVHSLDLIHVKTSDF